MATCAAAVAQAQFDCQLGHDLPFGCLAVPWHSARNEYMSQLNLAVVTNVGQLSAHTLLDCSLCAFPKQNRLKAALLCYPSLKVMETRPPAGCPQHY